LFSASKRVAECTRKPPLPPLSSADIHHTVSHWAHQSSKVQSQTAGPPPTRDDEDQRHWRSAAGWLALVASRLVLGCFIVGQSYPPHRIPATCGRQVCLDPRPVASRMSSCCSVLTTKFEARNFATMDRYPIRWNVEGRLRMPYHVPLQS
jgi:hypothetical protein